MRILIAILMDAIIMPWPTLVFMVRMARQRNVHNIILTVVSQLGH